MTRQPGAEALLSFVDSIAANDQTIDRYRWLAATLGAEGLEWAWEWRDGGRAAFRFRTGAGLMRFRASRLLLDRSAPGWAMAVDSSAA